MIRPLDAITLAYTKLRARKIRTAVTVAISGLLFGVLMATVFITSGILQSVEEFGKSGIGERYIVKTFPMGDGNMQNDPLFNPGVVKRVEELHKARVEAKKAEATRLGIEYSPEIEDPALVAVIEGETEKSINFQSQGNPAVKQALREYNEKNNKPFDIRDYTKGYDVKSYPELRTVQPATGELRPMEQGKESAIVESTSLQKKQASFQEESESHALRLIDSSITQPFMSAEFDPASGSTPVLLPYSQVERRLGLKPLDSSTTKQQRIERINEVRSRASEITIDMCYRNSASSELLNEAIRIDKEIAQKAKDKDYQKPALVYAIPEATSCGAVSIKEDTRTTSQKQRDDKQAEFDRKFNEKIDPEQYKLELQVVGVTPVVSAGQQGSLASAITLMFSPSIDEYWSVPAQLFSKLPAEKRPDVIFGDHSSEQTMNFNRSESLVEFNTLESARKFLKDYECTFTCGKGLLPMPFGSSSLIIADARYWIETILYWIVIGIATIAAIILTGMIGRTVADGRRETAVFRAIGARRSDITTIYTTYTLLLSFRIVVFAIILGLGLAFAVEWWMSAETTSAAQLTFGVTDMSKTFHFFGLNSVYTLVIPASIIAAALVAMIIPLLRNVRRNPIKDMRDE